MTSWDKIYKDYQSGGEAWATLPEDIGPIFITFLGETNFKLRPKQSIVKSKSRAGRGRRKKT